MDGEQQERSTENDCRLCGWEYETINGLWGHIPTHRLTQAQYGTLARYAALRAENARLLARVGDLEGERDGFLRMFNRAAGDYHSLMNGLLDALDLAIDEDGPYVDDQIIDAARAARLAAHAAGAGDAGEGQG